MPIVQTRCTQCGTDNETDADAGELRFGSGRAHGVEYLPCPECGHTTLQNRRGASVPASTGGR